LSCASKEYPPHTASLFIKAAHGRSGDGNPHAAGRVPFLCGEIDIYQYTIQNFPTEQDNTRKVATWRVAAARCAMIERSGSLENSSRHIGDQRLPDGKGQLISKTAERVRNRCRIRRCDSGKDAREVT
jgi:hypothetical protein